MRAMDQCCEIRTDLPVHQRRVLRIVLWLNALMFLAEFGAGLAAHSTALLADSVDMLGDAIVYGFSLYAVARGIMWQARVALLKGFIMAAFGLGVLIEVSHKLIAGVVPTPDLMIVVGLIALGANAVCLLLLSRHRGDDINMRSAWLCSRNDVIANASVLVAAGGVALTGSGWPDILVGLTIAMMFATSAIRVIRDARQQLRPAPARQEMESQSSEQR
jgi:cation diffusion facilitator family transporter